MSKGAQYSDEKLIESLLSGRGDVDAYEQIFHKYYPMVLNFIKGMLKDNVHAEDVAQNIFMKLWVNRYTLNKEQSLKNYLCVLARNEVINILSSKATRSMTHHAQLPDSASGGHEVDEWLSFVETNAKIRKDIEAMPPQRQMVFKMSRYENMSNMDIAIKMNLSVRTVEKHIELALKDLRKSMN